MGGFRAVCRTMASPGTPKAFHIVDGDQAEMPALGYRTKGFTMRALVRTTFLCGLEIHQEKWQTNKPDCWMWEDNFIWI